MALLIASAGMAKGQSGGLFPAVSLGGGYLDDPGRPYFFAQIRGTLYEDSAFRHTLFGEFLWHTDDAELEFIGPGGGIFFEDGDIDFINLTANYELEAKLSSTFSLYGGVGAGVELINLDDRFNFTVDSDSNFVAQGFAGVRANFDDFWAQLGVRYLFRDDFRLLRDQFVTEDSLAYELSVGFRF